MERVNFREMNLPDIYYLPEWGRAQQVIDKGEACIFNFKHSLGHIYYQFIKKRVPEELTHDAYYDTVTPYGYSGPIVLECDKKHKDSLIKKFDEEFSKYCQAENIIAEYIKFSPWLMNHNDFTQIYSIKQANYTLFTDLTVEDIFMEEYSYNVRKNIKKARRFGVELEYDFSGSSLEFFNRLRQKTFQRNAMSHYYDFSLSYLTDLVKSLKNRMFLINARFEDENIASGIFIEFGDYLHYWQVGIDYEHYSKNANSLIMYEAGIWGQKNGKKQLHMGGGSTNELLSFKKKFTKNGICDSFIGQKVRNEEIYNQLVGLRMKNEAIINCSFFPLYRG